MPENMKFPGTYSYNGEEIEVTLVNNGMIIIRDNFICNAKYLQFKSKSTGNTLCIPLGGAKGDKSTTDNPSYGNGFVLWSNTSDKDNRDGYAWATRYWPGNNSSYTIDWNYQVQKDSYAYVRCVKE